MRLETAGEVEACVAKVDPRGDAGDPRRDGLFYGEIGGWDAQLMNVLASYTALVRGGWLYAFTSFDPRPKPDITLPSILYGYGASGPFSGPTTSGLPAILCVCVCLFVSFFCMNYNVLIKNLFRPWRVRKDMRN